jgi:hypothetical protein
MVERALPPIHDTVRLWRGDESATLRACVRYREQIKPGWSLSWLRESASYIFGREVSESALKQAVRAKVPPDSRASVWRGVELLLEFVRKYDWQGVQLQGRDVPVGHGCTIRLRPIGKFFSPTLKRKCLLVLQPRLDVFPDYEQFRIWLSAIHYEFCCDPLEPLEALIVDLSRDERTGKRRLRELDPSKMPLLDKAELDQRLDLVTNCYLKAIELVPVLPAHRQKTRDTGQTDLF